jgi:hypothetical protein
MSQSVSDTLELFNLLEACYQKVNLLIIKNQATSAEDIQSFKGLLHERDELRALINRILASAYKASGQAIAESTVALQKVTQEIRDSTDVLQTIADGVSLVQKIVAAATTVAAKIG